VGGNTGEELTPVTIKKGQQYAIGTGDQIFIRFNLQTNLEGHLNETVNLKPSGNLPPLVSCPAPVKQGSTGVGVPIMAVIIWRW
jgi:hypothetical protein